MEMSKKNQDSVDGEISQRVSRYPFMRDITIDNVSVGLISAILGITGPPIIILEAAVNGHFTLSQTIAWMFSVYFFGGLIGIVMPLLFRIPITGAHTLSGVAFLATVTSQFTYPQLIGGYVMSGLIIFLVGVSGVFTKIIKWVPREVISSMLAGLVAGYVVQIVSAVQNMPIVGGVALVSYFVFMRSKKVPPVLVVVIAVIFSQLLTQHMKMGQYKFFAPSLHMPEFTLRGLLTLAFPLAVLILSNDAAPGIGALVSAGFNPPIRRAISLSGIFSVLTGIFGGQSANVAGMMTAICAGSDAGHKQKRYVASVVSGIVTLLFGLFAWMIVPFIQALPHSVVSMLAGFSLIGVLHSSLKMGFIGNQYRVSTLAAFIIALSNVSFVHISSPVWALIIGAFIANTLEKIESN